MELNTDRQQLLKKATVALELQSFCRSALVETERTVICQRCGSEALKEIACLPIGAYYCPFCIQYGRLTTNHVLYAVPAVESTARNVPLHWSGQLTKFQQRISDRLKQNFLQCKNSLVWSVTGSGKTEMVFEVVQVALAKGNRVAIVSPRIDVCRELYPRISSAFFNEDCLLLYGNSEEEYRFTNLLIATTHQLLHFYQAFDLIIVDEIDAYPFEGNRLLRFGLANALATTGSKIYLSATPSKALLKEISGEFLIEKMPVRYHKRSLILPKLLWYEKWESAYRSDWQFNKFLYWVKKLAKQNFVLVFCPSISYMEKLCQKTQAVLPEYKITSVSSKDNDRKEKVLRARKKYYRILFTTTILERGVTFEGLSVIVMGANHHTFSKSALVQIAGRVDRKGSFKNGQVLFFYNQMTEAIREAIMEIKEMNQLARKWLS